jgi:hypothetical protein
MKNIFKFALTVALVLMTSLTYWSCVKDDCQSTQVWTKWNPVYKTLAEIRIEPQVLPARSLKNPGKIYFYDRYLLINEIGEGIHIIDNSDARAPRTLAFLSIVGNVDIAVKDDVLYADGYMDMLTFDLRNIATPRLLNRYENTFIDSYVFSAIEQKYIVDYTPEVIERKAKCNDPKKFRQGDVWFTSGESTLATADANYGQNGSNVGNSAPSKVSIAGSYSRFAVAGNYLYTVGKYDLQVFNVTQAATPQKGAKIAIGWNIETIFPYKDKLFIGSNSTLFILDNRNPAQPIFSSASSFVHSYGCDPVFVHDDYAYVTIHAEGNECGGTNNELEVIDAHDLQAPKTIKIYPMSSPKGLAILNNTLYLCDKGLKIFDINNKSEIDKNLLCYINNVDAYDVIALPQSNGDKHLMLIGKNGFFQYDVTNPNRPQVLSSLPVTK